MKTTKQIQEDIDQLNRSIDDSKTDRQLKKISDQISELKQSKLYIESQPSETFIKSEVERIEKSIERIKDEENFRVWKRSQNHTDVQKLKTEYNKDMGLSVLKNQLKTLNYLLE